MGASITASDALSVAGIDVAEVRAHLPSIDPYAVRIRPASPWFQLFWARGIAALATPWGIFVRPPVFERLCAGGAPLRDGPLVVHELTHLEQFHRLGPMRHIVQYVSDYLRGRIKRLGHWEAYRRVRLEVEARQIAARFELGQTPR